MALEYIAQRTDLIDQWLRASNALDQYRLGYDVEYLHTTASILCDSVGGLAEDHQFWADLHAAAGLVSEHSEGIEQLAGDFDELLANEVGLLEHFMEPAAAIRLVSEVGLSVERLRFRADAAAVEQLRAGALRLAQENCQRMPGRPEAAEPVGGWPAPAGMVEDMSTEAAHPVRKKLVRALRLGLKGVQFTAGAALVAGNAATGVGLLPVAAGGPVGWAVIAGSVATGSGAMASAVK
jgi:hypothetical protein